MPQVDPVMRRSIRCSLWSLKLATLPSRTKYDFRRHAWLKLQSAHPYQRHQSIGSKTMKSPMEFVWSGMTLTHWAGSHMNRVMPCIPSLHYDTVKSREPDREAHSKGSKETCPYKQAADLWTYIWNKIVVYLPYSLVPVRKICGLMSLWGLHVRRSNQACWLAVSGIAIVTPHVKSKQATMGSLHTKICQHLVRCRSAKLHAPFALTQDTSTTPHRS